MPSPSLRASKEGLGGAEVGVTGQRRMRSHSGSAIPAPPSTVGLTPEASIPVPVGVHPNTGRAHRERPSLAPQAVLRKKSDTARHHPLARLGFSVGCEWPQSTQSTPIRSSGVDIVWDRKSISTCLSERKICKGGSWLEEEGGMVHSIWPEVSAGGK